MVAQPSFIFHGTPLPLVGVLIGLTQPIFSAGAKMCVRALRSSEALSYWEARSTEHSRKQAAVTAKLVAEGPAEDCVQMVVPPGTPPGTDLTYSSPVLGDTSGDSTDDSQSYQAGSEGVAETMAILSNQPESSAFLK
ncbi:hypothetical protein HaLaN_19063 [Haematococcus lacustris]|uniref:Uncharacterized protein n=1 Tax=Haematococcus lacustris TaxID=44745 RepID=A0A699ZIA3_HAELA|nr:hypothetical protein HaLaN_19063 [Haematococcus lacustris]